MRSDFRGWGLEALIAGVDVGDVCNRFWFGWFVTRMWCAVDAFLDTGPATGVVYCFDAEVLLSRLASTRTSLILMPFSFARVAIVSSTRLMRVGAKSSS